MNNRQYYSNKQILYIMKQVSVWMIILCVYQAHAQQQPHYTQYILNQFIINPALAGIENYTDIKASHRRQWIGLPGAPVTSYFSVHTPLGKQDDRITATSFEIPGENPRGKSYWENYTAAKPHHGIGVKIIDDRTGPLNRFGGYVAYAYHIGIGRKTSLAAGFEGGIRNISLDASSLDFGNLNPVDPSVYASGEINSVRPDYSFGCYVYSADYFVGLSAQQMIRQRIYFSAKRLNADSASELIPHFFATAGYRFLLDDDVTVLPSIMTKYVNPSPVQFDLNLKVQYRDLFWIGTSYRLKDGFAGYVGLNASNTFNVSYSYDYTTSGLSAVSKGTHEIVLGFLVGNKYKGGCPRNVW